MNLTRNVLRFALFILLSIILLVSCKKDNTNDPQNKDYRLSTVSYNEDGHPFTTTFSYNNNSQVTQTLGTTGDSTIYRTLWEYNGQIVTIHTEYYNNNAWIADNVTEKYTFTGDYLTKSDYYVDDSLYTFATYTWDGNKLMREDRTFPGSNTSSTIFEYQGDLLVKAIYYFNEEMSFYQTIEYTDNKPVSLKSFNPQNKLEDICDLVYTGNNITQVKNYIVEAGIEGYLNCTENRQYDNNSNITSVTTTCANDQTADIITITTEEGTSNFSQLMITQVGWVSVYLFPNTMPSDYAYKKK